MRRDLAEALQITEWLLSENLYQLSRAFSRAQEQGRGEESDEYSSGEAHVLLFILHRGWDFADLAAGYGWSEERIRDVKRWRVALDHYKARAPSEWVS